MGHDLVAALRARPHDGRRAEPLARARRSPRRSPAAHTRRRRLPRRRGASTTPWPASGARGACDRSSQAATACTSLPPRVGAREGERLQRRLVDLARGVLEVDEDAHATPICWSTSTTRGAAAAPSPSTSACLPSPSGTTSRSFSSRCSGRVGRSGLERLSLRAKPARDGRVARQVEPFLHADDGRQGEDVDVAAARRPPARSARSRPRPTRALSPVAIGRPSACATRMPTW